MFDEFKAEYGLNHITSSPHHPQANGSAESGVRILEQEDPFLSLMACRATIGNIVSKKTVCCVDGKVKH